MKKDNKCPFCLEVLIGKVKKCKSCGEYLKLLDRITHNILLPVFISLITGALLFNWGQNEERKNQEIIKSKEQKERTDKIIIFLKNELSQNYAALNNIKRILKKDLKYLNDSKFIIMPLGSFYFDAWHNAKFGGTTFLVDSATKDFKKLANFYFVLDIIQTKVRDRELYRIYNEGKPDFVNRMKILDKNILDNISKIRPILEQAQDYLYKTHDWIVKGDSFYVDKGLVVEISK